MNRSDLKVLREMISEAHTILATTKLPHGRSERAYELLSSAVALADSLIENPNIAAILGSKGGSETAKRGPEYYREIAAKRKTHGGGRPKKT